MHAVECLDFEEQPPPVDADELRFDPGLQCAFQLRHPSCVPERLGRASGAGPSLAMRANDTRDRRRGHAAHKFGSSLISLDARSSGKRMRWEFH